jgi:hypothetical protein
MRWRVVGLGVLVLVKASIVYAQDSQCASTDGVTVTNNCAECLVVVSEYTARTRAPGDWTFFTYETRRISTFVPPGESRMIRLGKIVGSRLTPAKFFCG